jgi:hypothetical protein
MFDSAGEYSSRSSARKCRHLLVNGRQGGRQGITICRQFSWASFFNFENQIPA